MGPQRGQRGLSDQGWGVGRLSVELTMLSSAGKVWAKLLANVVRTTWSQVVLMFLCSHVLLWSCSSVLTYWCSHHHLAITTKTVHWSTCAPHGDNFTWVVAASLHLTLSSPPARRDNSPADHSEVGPALSLVSLHNCSPVRGVRGLPGVILYLRLYFNILFHFHSILCRDGATYPHKSGNISV